MTFRPGSERSVARPPGTGALAALEGVLLMAWHVIATPFVGRRRLHWGASRTEAAAALPGDDLVPEPKWSYTHAVGIDAPPERVWPWIAQIGQGRGGFYSYQGLENLAGCRIRNVAEIVPEWQHPAVGDEVRLHPSSPPLRVEIVDPASSLVLFGAPAEIGQGCSTWQFVLQGAPGGSTRLLVRGRSDHGGSFVERLAFGRFPMEPILFVMSRKMMLGVKQLAEGR